MTERLIGLEYIRGVAAIGVASCHYFVSLESSELVELLSIVFVEAFFPLSGFVLANQIRIVAGDVSQYRIFLARRWMRTIPAYLLALIVISILSEETSVEHVLKYIFFIKYVSYTAAISDFYPVAWSLAVEEWYYVFIPIAIIYAARFGNVRLLFGGIAVFLLLYAGKILVISYGEVDQYRTITWCRLDAILLGYLFYEWYTELRRSRPIVIVSVFSFIALIVIIFDSGYRDLSNVMTMIVLLLISICFSGLITLFYDLERRKIIQFGRVSSYIGMWFGRISYNIYLFHLVLLLLLERIGRLDLPVVYFGGLVIFGVVFFISFESPLLAMRPSYKPPS